MVIRLLIKDKTRSDISLVENFKSIYQMLHKIIDTKVEFKSGQEPDLQI